MKGFIDKYLNIAISKKLTAFAIACIALFMGKLNGQEWMVITSAYVGVQGFIDIVKEYYKSK